MSTFDEAVEAGAEAVADSEGDHNSPDLDRQTAAAVLRAALPILGKNLAQFVGDESEVKRRSAAAAFENGDKQTASYDRISADALAVLASALRRKIEEMGR